MVSIGSNCAPLAALSDCHLGALGDATQGDGAVTRHARKHVAAAAWDSASWDLHGVKSSLRVENSFASK